MSLMPGVVRLDVPNPTGVWLFLVEERDKGGIVLRDYLDQVTPSGDYSWVPADADETKLFKIRLRSHMCGLRTRLPAMSDQYLRIHSSRLKLLEEWMSQTPDVSNQGD